MRFEFINMSWKRQGLYSVNSHWFGDEVSHRECVSGFLVQKEEDGTWTALLRTGSPANFRNPERRSGFRTRLAACEHVAFELHDNEKPERYTTAKETP